MLWLRAAIVMTAVWALLAPLVVRLRAFDPRLGGTHIIDGQLVERIGNLASHARGPILACPDPQ